MARVRLTSTRRHRPGGPAGAARKALALATVLSAAGVQTAVSAGTAQAAPTWTEGPVFNDPLGEESEQLAIRTRLIDLTAAALPGSTIKVAVYHVWEASVVDALVAAKDRGVNVQVLLDESSVSDRPANTAYGSLVSALGTDRTKGSYIATCPVDKSCLGDPKYGQSIMHNKFWLFSAVEGATNVVVQTTSNSTPSAHTKFFNDALLLPNNPTMYDAYADYFDTMVGRDWAGWEYRTVSNGLYKAYFFPRAGSTRATDSVYSVLNNVQCSYKDTAGVTRKTWVRVAIFKITRMAIAEKLVALKKAGCNVSIVYAESDSAKSSGGTPGTWEKMHTSGGPTVRCYNDDRDPLNPGQKLTTPYIIHSKYILVDGAYDGVRNKISFTGSGNYTGPALRENDESIVKVDDDAVHDMYKAHFDQVIKVAHPGKSDTTDLCKGVKPLPADGEKPTG
ncbi:phospholipase D-like domain-containing protein [Streptomyces neyagawaensis]|uniref:phospholipase D-like domain-containing protein n=1 Tax=Streptomyces neyagawaensis TaxID=42238 RepID=UPI0006E2FB0D|nr:phospholipase D-like domain-containing protein [Streptomyces neyagawaensis]MCL6739459.1 phospholipase D-like domain-containing protein [Streptomyces neyagawaensis]MDE1685235.1 phospholipase D-like domain-containing protein [Streptomyces neyagawaensis]